MRIRQTDDILARFAQARELDQRVKTIAAERGERVTAEMYRSVIDVIADNLEPIPPPKIQDLEHCWSEAIGDSPDSTAPVDVE